MAGMAPRDPSSSSYRELENIDGNWKFYRYIFTGDLPWLTCKP